MHNKKLHCSLYIVNDLFTLIPWTMDPLIQHYVAADRIDTLEVSFNINWCNL